MREEAVLADLSERFASEALNPGEALGELVVFAEGHPQRVMLLSYLLAEQLRDGLPGTPSAADAVIGIAIERTQAAHQALWTQLRQSERVVLACAADGVAPASNALAAEHKLARSSLHEAAERLIGQGHLTRHGRSVRVLDPLLAEWLRRR